MNAEVYCEICYAIRQNNPERVSYIRTLKTLENDKKDELIKKIKEHLLSALKTPVFQKDEREFINNVCSRNPKEYEYITTYETYLQDKKTDKYNRVWQNVKDSEEYYMILKNQIREYGKELLLDSEWILSKFKNLFINESPIMVFARLNEALTKETKRLTEEVEKLIEQMIEVWETESLGE